MFAIGCHARSGARVRHRPFAPHHDPPASPSGPRRPAEVDGVDSVTETTDALNRYEDGTSVHARALAGVPGAVRPGHGGALQACFCGQ